MAKSINSMNKTDYVPTKPKGTRQGDGKNTKYSASSRNVARKKYRGQGKG